MAVREKQQENNEAMAEMEKLLSVARREHGKAVVQLQQLQRQLGRDRDKAMEAMKLNQTNSLRLAGRNWKEGNRGICKELPRSSK